jgi:mannonate dehydratase
MLLGTQVPARDDDDYRVLAQLGVTHVCADPPGNPHDWTLDVLLRHRAHVESFGLILDMVQLPLSSRPIEESLSPDIMTAGPERDRQIESICRLIENLSRAGIPAAKYNLNIIGIPARRRSAGAAGR